MANYCPMCQARIFIGHKRGKGVLAKQVSQYIKSRRSRKGLTVIGIKQYLDDKYDEVYQPTAERSIRSTPAWKEYSQKYK